jgi:hypothetical protein
LRCVQPFALQEEAAGYGLTVGHDLTDDGAVALNALWNLDKHRRLPRLCWGIVFPVWWSHPDPSVQYLWTSSLDEGESLSDGMAIGKFRSLQDRGRSTTDPTIEFEIHLDDCRPYGPSSLTRTLHWLHRSICGWAIPRMFITGSRPRAVSHDHVYATGHTDDGVGRLRTKAWCSAIAGHSKERNIGVAIWINCSGPHEPESSGKPTK